ncbi:MAG: protoporphyrinogen oxidase [Rhodothermaceae bacterium]|nr:protoporphyrinogen oxidase [Rhodothermaceae bacterium]MXX58932.1 protoporphyrinogen oxidase [Rhodothermaceae bacterium]MYD18768.1 protoporphyrinogen oxidase [Rhodothermaceae bacterium]MYD56635.1 protoporphyrinogen oxidase [Rhodothermaceae bacterium]MYI43598.1 protoporphyrinogen oxidase [Rhodothermaceae bacterium]
MRRVVIVGGGITGLAAAWALRQTSAPPDIVLLEKNNRLGGCIHTEHCDGFLMEHGPDVFLTRKPEANLLCKELRLPLQKTNQDRRGVYLRHGKELYRAPEGMSGLVPGKIWPLISSPLLSLRGKLRVLAELLLPPSADDTDESVEHFFCRRFGREAYSTLIEPLLGGLAGGDASRLSIKALMPHVLSLESRYGSLLLGISRGSTQKTHSSLRSLPGGLSSLVTALESVNVGSIRLAHEVTGIKKTAEGWKVGIAAQESLQATDVILAVPAWSAARITDPVNPELNKLLQSIAYRSGTMVHLAYHRVTPSRALDAYGHLVARSETSSVAACTWSSVKLNGRAPVGDLLFRIYLRGTDLSDEAVLSRARAEMALALGITAEPLFTRIHRFPAALPQYTLGHAERVNELRNKISSCDGLFVAGNYLDGVGIPDCIRNGMHAAHCVLDRHQDNSSVALEG